LSQAQACFGSLKNIPKCDSSLFLSSTSQTHKDKKNPSFKKKKKKTGCVLKASEKDLAETLP